MRSSTNFSSTTHTDNAHLASKVALRRRAVSKLDHVRILDAFAGYNTLWKDIPKERYYGIEMIPGKGKNLHADNLKVLPGIDLSDFTVIDLDSYGSSIPQLKAVLGNSSLTAGTVILFTEIHSHRSGIPIQMLPQGLRAHYSECPFLFAKFSDLLFQMAFSDFGIKSWIGYSIYDAPYYKTYGYFTISDDMLRNH